MPNQTSEKTTHRRAFQKLLEAEKKFDFYKLSYNNIPLWINPRFMAALFISGLELSTEQAAPFLKIKPINILRRIMTFFLNLNKIFGNDIIVFTNERHLQWSNQDNSFYNQYAELVLEKTTYKKALIFEFPTAMTTKYKKIKYKRYLMLDFIIALKTIFSFCYLFFYPKIKKEFYPKFKESNLWQPEDVKKVLKLTALQAYSIKCYGAFLDIVKLLNPQAKVIYSCMAAYDKFPGVVEIQHGLIDDIHPQYIYPDVSSLKDYLQNQKIIVFSDKIKKMFLNCGYLDQNIEVKPNPKIYFYFLKNVKKDFFGKKLQQKEIVIIGGWWGSTGEKTKNFVINIEENKEKFKDWNISLILHPSEKNTYKNLGLSKVKIFENHEVSMWEMLSKSLCVAGVLSSVLEEATFFGCFEIIIENKDLEDQKKAIEWMCGDYPYKVKVLPDNFSQWFEDNEQNIVNHWKLKKEIMKKNYDYFQDYNKNISEIS